MPAPRLHPFWRLLICAGGLLASSGLVVVVMTMAVRWSAALTNRVAQTEIVEFWADPVNMLWATLFFYPLALICLIVCRHSLDRRSVSSLGLHASLPTASPSSVRSFGGGAACGALAISFLFGMLWCAGGVRIVGFSPEAFSVGPWVSLAMLVIYGALFFSVGFMEELMFRGYALHNLRVWLGLSGAIAVQAVLFAAGHAGNGGTLSLQSLLDEKWAMLNLVLIGYFFAFAYLKTGTLWFPIGFHAAWNWCLGCLWSLPVSGIPVFKMLDVTSAENVALSGGKFGAEGSVLLAPIILVMLWILHKMPDHPHATGDLASLEPPYDDDATEPGDAAVYLNQESDWPEPDPNRERRFKTSMKADSEPEIDRVELDQLARELEESSRRAAGHAVVTPPAPVLPTMPASGAVVDEEAAPTPPAVPAPAAVDRPIESPRPVAPEMVIITGKHEVTEPEVVTTAPELTKVQAEKPVAKKPRW